VAVHGGIGVTIALLVITDGRVDYLERAVESARECLNGPVTERIMFDDTGDASHRAWLAARFPEFTHIHAGARQGFGGAISGSWAHLAESTCDYVFHLEQDFVFNRPVDLSAMMYVLDTQPHLVQLALRRQPWNPDEAAAGGIVEQHPADYVDCTDGVHWWLEHTRFFTTNPSLYRRSLIGRGWPAGAQSEGRFGLDLLRVQPTARFGFWGTRASGEWVTHIGHERVGVGY
jgi:hypothetical protein